MVGDHPEDVEAGGDVVDRLDHVEHLATVPSGPDDHQWLHRRHGSPPTASEPGLRSVVSRGVDRRDRPVGSAASGSSTWWPSTPDPVSSTPTVDDQDAQVERDRLAVDVLEVELDALGPARARCAR